MSRTQPLFGLRQATDVTDDDSFVMSDNPRASAEGEQLKKVTAAQVRGYFGSQLSGQFTPNFTYTEAVGPGGNEMTFRLLQSGATAYQHVLYDFTNSGSANPDFTIMKHGARLWYFDLDVLGDEIGIVIGSNGHPGLSDARGWTNSYSFTATKSDLNPATATAAQCAERINALINALTRLSTSEGHGLLR